jgi:hypothetical protein
VVLSVTGLVCPLSLCLGPLGPHTTTEPLAWCTVFWALKAYDKKTKSKVPSRWQQLWVLSKRGFFQYTRRVESHCSNALILLTGGVVVGQLRSYSQVHGRTSCIHNFGHKIRFFIGLLASQSLWWIPARHGVMRCVTKPVNQSPNFQPEHCKNIVRTLMHFGVANTKQSAPIHCVPFTHMH